MSKIDNSLRALARAHANHGGPLAHYWRTLADDLAEPELAEPEPAAAVAVTMNPADPMAQLEAAALAFASRDGNTDASENGHDLARDLARARADLAAAADVFAFYARALPARLD